MRHILSTALLALACIALLLCSAPLVQAANLGQELASQSAIEQVLRRGVLRVGMSTFEPWAMKDKDGEFMGYEIDVANRLAQDMGVKLELVHTQWSGIIPALLTGKFDMIIGGMSIRPDRALKVNFSIPYNVTGMSLVAHQQKAQGFSKLQDFDKPGVVIAARTGTSAAQAAQKYLPKATLRLFDSEPQALQELLNGNAHAFVSTAPKPAFEAIAHKDKLFLPFPGTFTSEPNAIAVRKGDPDALNYLDSWIRAVAAEGWFAERYTYWFETRDWANRLP
ncbi:transporter substrate-binding domain-containing protein [Desulfocurvibacter africanus]|uniref:ABC-type transporter, periplasmic subunit family 3 n=1 Tax=Desulfocurvibacter africanus subsp. africanus str. Walvis Bay TaxID=690850 RepID=F3YY01_DESAF|nr:transporter substrate-binding domain-containing protein [Desulfocurvibacter africanus]EGJ50703.1 ABC-type transporter, periplasmic subunit family 3 [Desulfocurvibacter africanus subsp. africanus str. Walvis Bay]